MRAILPSLEAALSSFQSSKSAFRVLRSINLSPSSKTSSNPSASPKTLFILDSSFNPPSRAHLALARSALHESSTKQHEAPYRLLLLFSTHNADKAPSAASFPQRLALMTVFAQDLLHDLTARNEDQAGTYGDEHNENQSLPGDRQAYVTPTIDIGVTTAPYYTDKSAAIRDEGHTTYPTDPVHVHILGYDTLTRILAAKYYAGFTPPLSALAPFFDGGHGLRVTLRPSDEYGSVEEQRRFIEGLAEGRMEHDGADRRWAGQIETVEAGDGVGVSSTRIRKAAKEGDWKEVEALCTEGVARAIRDEAVYEGDDRGSKMA